MSKPHTRFKFFEWEGQMALRAFIELKNLKISSGETWLENKKLGRKILQINTINYELKKEEIMKKLRRVDIKTDEVIFAEIAGKLTKTYIFCMEW